MGKKKTKAQKRFERQRRAAGGTVSPSVEVHGNVIKIKQTFTANDYDFSWDEEDDDDGKWDEKFMQWESRNWELWLKDNLKFPFTARREDDDGASFVGGVDKDTPFSLGHIMQVLGLEWDPGYEVFLAKVKEGDETGLVPLCDLEVEEKSNSNYRPVREYAVWFVNR